MMMIRAILMIFVLMASPIMLTELSLAQNIGMQTLEIAPREPISNALPSIDGKPKNSATIEPAIPTKPGDVTLPTTDFKTLREDKTDIVKEIIDPLTFRLESTGIVRLSALDIPDLNPYQPGPLAESALTILRDMLENRRVVLYQTLDRERGRSNRLQQKLYHISIEENNSWVQGVLVRLGLARVRTDKSNPEMAAELYALEIMARSENLGLWADEANTIRTPENAENFLNSFQIVEGTVMSAARKQNNIFLNFGNDWRKDFTVSIPSSQVKLFNKANINPLDLNGKKIRVRGWIRSYNGAYIEIDHPETIEIVTVKE